MSTTSEYYKKALEIVRSRGDKAKNDAQIKRSYIETSVPEFRAIELKIQSIFSDSVRRKLAGEQVDFDKISDESIALQNQRDEILAAAGLKVNDLEPKYKCNKCNDSGYFGGKMCECVKALATKMIYDEINRDVPLDDNTFANFRLDFYPDISDQNGINPRTIMSKVFELCQNYAVNFSNKSPSILFCGKTGVGKTFLSLSIANVVLQNGHSVVYAPLSRILQQIENEYFSRDVYDNKTLDSVIFADLLIIDDLGAEFGTSFTTSTIYDIINSRLLSSKPTIINTNLSPEEIEKRYTKRVASRINGNYNFIQVVGEDNRGK